MVVRFIWKSSVVAGASFRFLQQLSVAAGRVREYSKSARGSRVVLLVACHAVVRMHSVIRHWLTPQYVLSGEKPRYPPKRMRSGASISLRSFYGKVTGFVLRRLHESRTSRPRA